jgi:UDP-3-O-[3-hydroxymyristoyl] glucosamine N-acyltransferase
MEDSTRRRSVNLLAPSLENCVTVGELIHRLGGELIQGDPATRLFKVADVSSAATGDLVFGENAAAVADAQKSDASAAVVPAGSEIAVGTIAVIAAKQPRLWFAKAARIFAVPAAASGVHPAAVVSPDAVLGDGISIGAGVVVGERVTIGTRTRIDAGAVIGDGVMVGEACRIHPRAVLYPGTTVGDRVVIHAGAVLGADGFGYVRDRETGSYTQFPQQGTLVIEDDVEIGANTTIDRGALAETRIRRGVKLDNLVHIGHNCDIGEDVVIASQTGISGSSTVGYGAILAGQVGIGDHAHVGPSVILGGQAGVLSGKTIDTTGTVLWGTPAKPLREYLRELATLSRLARRKKGD